MAHLGRINTLIVKRTRDYGAHLDGGETGDILLPISEVPDNCQAGDEVVVFVYLDKRERLRATTKTPKATVGQFAKLKVVANSPSGLYLDWGLPKDLFVPKREQLNDMLTGKSYIVFVFLDHTNRITASAKLEQFLGQKPPGFKEGEAVDLIIYGQTELGYMAVVNHTHGGLLYKNEVFQKIFIGQQLQGYVKKIREDNKIDLSLQQSGFQGVDTLSRTILKTIKDQGGRIKITDKSPPEEIYAMFGVSKKIFKKAIGTLYKKRLVTMDPKGIRLVK